VVVEHNFKFWVTSSFIKRKERKKERKRKVLHAMETMGSFSQESALTRKKFFFLYDVSIKPRIKIEGCILYNKTIASSPFYLMYKNRYLNYLFLFLFLFFS